MPFLNPTRVRHRMAEFGFPTSHALAEATTLTHGCLKNAISAHDPLGLPGIYELARLLRRSDEDVRLVVADMLADGNDGVPDEPPHQPTQPKGPDPRKDRETRKTGPARSRPAA